MRTLIERLILIATASLIAGGLGYGVWVSAVEAFTGSWR